MARIQCKMCGGELNLPEGIASGACEYCGSMVTFPKISSDTMENLYNRAEHFRRINDYDKAVAAYEKVISANPDDAEAYWGLVLSRFGIEYVEDPVSHERIPTCHRVQFESVLADPDYLTALERAGSAEKEIYQHEAQRIAEIQKGILAISNNEEPFDVFICYKESDEFGKRTRDSVIAQDIYYALTQEGLKVFFARITLEGKLGQQYEPYIFAALNSAKAMLVIGSKKEYFEAVWVKNEWSRFLALMKKDRSKLLIPCYKDMDAYDIPEELSLFQAQDMSKIGFIQDILHGIKKVVQKNQPPVAAIPVKSVAPGKIKTSHQALATRLNYLFATDNFQEASAVCKRLMADEPENCWGYFYDFLLAHNVTRISALSNVDIDNDKVYLFIRRIADDELKAILDPYEQEWRDASRKRRKQVEKCSIYRNDIYKNIDILKKQIAVNKQYHIYDARLNETLNKAQGLLLMIYDVEQNKYEEISDYEEYITDVSHEIQRFIDELASGKEQEGVPGTPSSVIEKWIAWGIAILVILSFTWVISILL